jgi:hypothetical protein
VLLKRCVIRTVVERNAVWPPFESRKQLAMEDEFFHGPDPLSLNVPVAATQRVRIG